jgi:hypothetical protein
MYFTITDRRERQQEQSPNRPTAPFALDQPKLGATSSVLKDAMLRLGGGTHCKKHNDRVGNLGVPPIANVLISFIWGNPPLGTI